VGRREQRTWSLQHGAGMDAALETLAPGMWTGLEVIHIWGLVTNAVDHLWRKHDPSGCAGGTFP